MHKCSQCDFIAKNLHSLAAHKRKHSNYTQTYIMCCSILTHYEIPIHHLEQHDLNYHNSATVCPQCNKTFYTYKNSAKKFCSRPCATSFHNLNAKPDRKFGPARKIKETNICGPYTSLYRNVCQKTGIVFYWHSWRKYHPSISIDKQDYYRQCQFNFSLNKYPDYFDLNLIKEYGWYSTPGSRRGKKNTNGISRDHMVSVSYGWENKIDPKIISHPANCKLVRHKDNQHKRTKCSITLGELLVLIEDFDKKYTKHP
jgi:hypothetical protein